MTLKEKTKEAVIKATVDGKMTVADAANRLKISSRQIRKLKAKMRNGISLKHGNCKSSPKRRKDDDRELIIQHYKDPKFSNVNFAHFRELLEDLFEIKIAYKQLHAILTEAGFKSPKKQRKRKVHKSRLPREHFGEMLQTDASPHQWFLFFGDNAFYSLHGFLDDATGIPTGLFFCKNECLDGYFESFRQTLENYGVPGSIYADGLNIFFAKEHQPTIVELLDGITERKTQFGAILHTLGVDLIRAGSAQAKGKIERLWQTFQSRLVVEFQIRGIDNIEKANKYLPRFIVDYKKKFAKSPTSDKSDFLPLIKGINLDILLTKRVTRKLDAGLTFSLNNNKFVVPGLPPKVTIEVAMSSRIGFRVLYKEKLYEPKPLVQQERVDDLLYYYLHKNEKLQYGHLDIRKHDVVQMAL